MNEEAAVATAKMNRGEGQSRAPQSAARHAQRLDRYEIERLLGKGGFASVYQGYDPRIRRPVAIKRCSSLDQSDHERFFREAEIAGNLSHVNIVRIFDFGVAEGVPFIVQELLGGRDLADWIESGLQLSNRERVRILLQVAQGLAYAHSRDVIHRDVKPANIRVLDDGSIKLLDFGVAAIRNAPSNLTGDQMTVGTAAYLAPEQIRGENPDRATDIFSFGVVAYELLSGHRPFEGATLSAVLYRVAHHQPEPLRSGSLPESLVQLVHKCLRKSKQDRPEDFEQIVEELEEALRDPRLGPASIDAGAIGCPAPGPSSPKQNSHSRPSPGARAEPSTPRAAPKARPAGARARPIRDSSIRIQVARAPRAKGSSRLALLATVAAIPVYFLAGGSFPAPVDAALAGAERWLASAIEDWSSWLEPIEPAPRPVGVPARAGEIRTAAATAPARATKPLRTPEPGLDPVSAAIEALDAAKAPKPKSAAPTRARARRVSATAPATVFVPPSWHPQMTISVDGDPLRPLDSRQTRQLAPGRHALTFVLETETYATRRTLDIWLDPAEIRTLESPLAPPGALRFQVIPESSAAGSIEIDGRRLELPLSQLQILEPGDHKIVFHPSAPDPLGPLAKRVNLSASSVHLATFDMRRRRAEIEVEGPFEWNGE